MGWGAGGRSNEITFTYFFYIKIQCSVPPPCPQPSDNSIDEGYESGEEQFGLYLTIAKQATMSGKRVNQAESVAELMTTFEERAIKRTRLLLDSLQAVSHAVHSHVSVNSRGSVTAVRKMFGDQFNVTDTQIKLGWFGSISFPFACIFYLLESRVRSLPNKNLSQEIKSTTRKV